MLVKANMIEKLKRNFINRETVLYALFGFLTFIISGAIFQGLIHFGIDYKISNIFSLILGKLFAYIMNKLVIFQSKNSTFFEFCKEFARFLFARGLTGLIDYFGVIVAVEILKQNKVISKYFFMIIVILLNYLLGKKVVFKDTDNGGNNLH